MLNVDDRFKSWMRYRLNDREYAERIMRILTELEDCNLVDVYPHAALPVQPKDDPELMIGLIKGHDNKNDFDFLVAIFGKWEDFEDMAHTYFYNLWRMYNPISYRDFENLPLIYEIAFTDSDMDEAIIKKRWNVRIERDGQLESIKEFDGIKINLVNTRIESDVLSIVMGKDI
ncbi:MAG: hypothetical protein IJ062_02520 [Firmicutes bacterium]|nr:hypothetical protein [Bacillota bacterium]